MTASTRINGVLNPGVNLASGEYQITKPLGQGGFGITYLGRDMRLNRSVAVKEFFPEGCWREGTTVVSAGRWNANTYTNAKQKFLQEGQTLGQFNHPGIVRVFYYFEENNTAYLVMEYLRGQTLGQLLKNRGGKLPETEALFYMKKIAKALEVLHQSQFLHRDIKPDNIMLADDGRVVLIDFGAARDFAANNTERFTTMLTPGYAPLEQYGQALKYGAFTDIYALGSTFYHMLTGKVPPSAIERAAGVELQALRKLEPSLSPHLEQGIMKAMEMKVEERSQSITEFLEFLHLDPVDLPQPSTKINFYQSHQDPWSAFRSNSIQSRSHPPSNSDRWF
ncbi:MAG: serine/threonine protein kinase [Pleurocapsa sp.]